MEIATSTINNAIGNLSKISPMPHSGHSFHAKEEADDTPHVKENTKLSDSGQAASASGADLTQEQQQELTELKRRDAEVRAHEQAHLSAAGGLARGSVNYSYENGPDGKRYAVGGDVSIDTGGVPGDPQATLLKAQQIRRAATAPNDPSSQDRSVAAEASRMEAQARAEISQQAREKQSQAMDENIPEVGFFGAKIEQNEKNIQDTYTQIQNTRVLEEQKSYVDFFI